MKNAIITICLILALCIGQPTFAGYIKGWGWNDYGQATSPDGNNFIAIAAGDYHSLALKSDGTIVGWGDNEYGQATPPDGNNFIAIATGGIHSLALKANGSIVGWGWNAYGQATPPDGNEFIVTSAGVAHSLGLKSDGTIIGWGANYSGQMTPPEGNDFIAIAAGYWHSLALKSDGAIVGWGNNGQGEATPPEGNNFVAISGGYTHSLAIINTNPIADAGPNQAAIAWIDGIAEVTLDGSRSYDEDGDELSYLWTWSIDGDTYDTNEVNPTIELPVGVHKIELVVNDGWADSEPDEVVITVIEPIKGSLKVVPRTINGRNSKKNIKAALQLPADISEDEIDTSEKLLLYPGEIVADSQHIQQRGRGGITITADFEASELINAVGESGEVQVDVVGQLKSGQYFYGSDTIKIIHINQGRRAD